MLEWLYGLLEKYLIITPQKVKIEESSFKFLPVQEVGFPKDMQGWSWLSPCIYLLGGRGFPVYTYWEGGDSLYIPIGREGIPCIYLLGGRGFPVYTYWEGGDSLYIPIGREGIQRNWNVNIVFPNINNLKFTTLSRYHDDI